MRHAAKVVVLATALGLGVLAGVGAALPGKKGQDAGVDPTALFTRTYRRCAESGWRPASPWSACATCMAAAADHRLNLAEARVHCGGACGLE